MIAGKGNSYSIYDWKTTKDIFKDNRSSGITPQTKNVRDTKLNKYELQLSGYRYLLEKYHGIKIKNQFVVHLLNDGFKLYQTEYNRSLISSIFESKKANSQNKKINRKTKPVKRKIQIEKGNAHTNNNDHNYDFYIFSILSFVILILSVVLFRGCFE